MTASFAMASKSRDAPWPETPRVTLTTSAAPRSASLGINTTSALASRASRASCDKWSRPFPAASRSFTKSPTGHLSNTFPAASRTEPRIGPTAGTFATATARPINVSLERLVRAAWATRASAAVFRPPAAASPAAALELQTARRARTSAAVLAEAAREAKRGVTQSGGAPASASSATPSRAASADRQSRPARALLVRDLASSLQLRATAAWIACNSAGLCALASEGLRAFMRTVSSCAVRPGKRRARTRSSALSSPTAGTASWLVSSLGVTLATTMCVSNFTASARSSSTSGVGSSPTRMGTRSAPSSSSPTLRDASASRGALERMSRSAVSNFLCTACCGLDAAGGSGFPARGLGFRSLLSSGTGPLVSKCTARRAPSSGIRVSSSPARATVIRASLKLALEWSTWPNLSSGVRRRAV
mmetsp:Transcript_31925/g.99641  ORF Transcript_31925/g.99641 Transcript_31925/m.99641 type:complete len:419 (+) Transcript_31925:571-1827(+)